MSRRALFTPDARQDVIDIAAYLSEFDNYIIYYLPIERGIKVVPVLRGARDVNRIMQIDPEE